MSRARSGGSAMRWYRSIETQMSAILLVVSTVVCVLLSVGSSYYIQKETHHFELEVLEKIANAAGYNISAQSEELSTVVADWAQWDDTYQYLIQPYQAYLTDNFSQGTLERSKLAGAQLYSVNGELVASSEGFLDGASGISVAVAGALARAGGSQVSGVLAYRNTTLFFSAHAVTDTDAVRQSNGWLVMFRHPNSLQLDQFGRALGVTISVEQSFRPSVPLAFLMRGTLSAKYRHSIEDASDLLSASYYLVFDNSQLPIVLNIGSKQPLGFMSSLKHLVVPLVTLFFGMSGILVLLLRSHVTRPIVNICRALSGPKVDAERLKQLAAGRNDEFSRLAFRVKSLFDQVYAKNSFNELLLDAIGDEILTINEKGEVVYVNPSASEWLSMPMEQLRGQRLDFLLNNCDDNGSTAFWVNSVLAGKSLHQYCRIRVLGHSDEQTVEVKAHPIAPNGPGDQGGIFIIRQHLVGMNEYQRQMVG
ncbi:hypothetical protein DU002_00425 [Corallincola holothuriorum]|uniref:PAS domain-containing protein n=2 Tax=Corallincola holothuriorum TaxID=2282215 RepID=A0A368NQU5_9GAMM|nr:hypothetical protein DU002_00425 [Corallincola holothuriorum]